MAPRTNLRIIFCLSLLLSALIASRQVFTYEHLAQSDQEARLLEPGKTVEREIAAGESHRYSVNLLPDQYLHLTLGARGTAIIASLISPGGKTLIIEDTRYFSNGEVRIAVIAQETGAHHLEVRSPDKAAGRYKLGIVELRAATDQDRKRVNARLTFAEGTRLRAQGTAESLRKAIEKYKEAVELLKAVGDSKAAADALAHIGVVYASLNEHRNALEFHNQSLQLYREIGDRLGIAVALYNMGLAHNALGEKQKALESYNQAIPLFREVDRVGQAATLRAIGELHASLNEHQKALDHYLQALPIYRAEGERRREASALNIIGAAYSRLDEYRQAIEYYNQALALYRTLGDRPAEAYVLINIGATCFLLDEYEKGISFFNEALPILREVDDRRAEAAAVFNIGRAQASLNRYHKAVDDLTQALALTRAVNDRRREAGTLAMMGQVHSSLGEYDRALDYYNQAIQVIRASSDRLAEATTLANIAAVYVLIGEYQKALDHYHQALPILRAANDRRAQASVLNGMGETYASLRDAPKALESYNQALALHHAIENRRGEAIALSNIGRLHLGSGDHQKAMEYLNRALSLIRAVKDRRTEAQMLYHAARAYEKGGDILAARSTNEAAIALIESLRPEAPTQQSRASFFASVRSFYDLGIDLLMRLHGMRPGEGFEALAFETSERARARTLLELLAEAGTEIRQGVDPVLIERERSLALRLNAKAERQAQLLAGKPNANQLAAADKEIESLLAEYQQVQALIRANSPRYAALTQPQPASLSHIQSRVLDPDTLLLEYALGEERSYLWAISATSLTSYDLPRRADIEAAARRFYEQLRRQGDAVTQGRGELEEAAHQLSRMLLSPVADRLESKRLVIVADGILHYIPFAALSIPETRRAENDPRVPASPRPRVDYVPLIAKHEIISLPSASVLAEMRRELAGRKPAARAVAVLADPVFSTDDTRLKSAGKPPPGERVLTRDLERAMRDVDGSFSRLPFSRREAEAIIALAPRGQSIKSLDFQASRDTATSVDLSNYRIIHFATHGLLNNNHPELSGIVLSLVDQNGQPQNGFLRLHEVYDLKLPAELVVLSACQTGLGKEVRGEGIVGLTRGFMYAGAARIVASLWKVDDAATAELMKRFYRGIFIKGLRPAAALREAQVEMWKEERWQLPYYWAAFVIQGEWK